MTLGLIWAESSNGVIGFDGAMPWHLPEDLAHFTALTKSGSVLMGRRTWDSLPPRFRPLPGRANIVITRQPGWAADGAIVAHSVDQARALVTAPDTWVIGGLEIFALTVGDADVLEVTEINAEYRGDTRAPVIPAGWRRGAIDPEQGWHTSRTGIEYRFVRYLAE
jgi:dihydrofolate reductase